MAFSVTFQSVADYAVADQLEVGMVWMQSAWRRLGSPSVPWIQAVRDWLGGTQALEQYTQLKIFNINTDRKPAELNRGTGQRSAPSLRYRHFPCAMNGCVVEPEQEPNCYRGNLEKHRADPGQVPSTNLVCGQCLQTRT